MDQPALMRVGQASCCLLPDESRLLGGEQLAGGQHVAQGATGEILGDQVGDGILLAPVVDLQDVGVVQCRDGSGLGSEALEEGSIVGERRLQQLDGHRALKRRVLCQVHVG